jgi:hypothetical protein
MGIENFLENEKKGSNLKILLEKPRKTQPVNLEFVYGPLPRSTVVDYTRA